MKTLLPEIDFEIYFFKKILRKSPDYIEALIPLAEAYTKKGMIEEGLIVDEKLSRLLPEDSTVFYNLACSQALLNQKKEAMKSLKKSISLGYDDIDHMLHDEDLNNLHELESFHTLIKKFVKK